MYEYTQAAQTNVHIKIVAYVDGARFVFVLRFYCLVNSMGLCRARSVYLTTRLQGRLSPLSQYCAHSFARN